MKPTLIALLLFGIILISGCSSNAIEELNLNKEYINEVKADEVTKNDLVDVTEEPIDTYNNKERNEYVEPESNFNYNNSVGNDYDYSNQGSCCKICSKGKACGDSCISRSYTCHKGVWCACDW